MDRRQSLYLLQQKLINPMSSFVILILIARRSDVRLGEYAVATTFYVVMQALPLMGLTPFLMRAVSREPAATGRLVATIGLLAALACVPVAALGQLLVALGPYSPDVRGAVRVLGLAIVAGILAFIVETSLIALGRAGSVATLSTIENLLRVAGSAYVLSRGSGVVALMWVVAGTKLASLLALTAALRRAGHWPSRLAPDTHVLAQVRVVLPTFLVNSVLAMVMSRFDYFVLSFHEPVSVVGHYAIAYRMLEISLLATTAPLTSVFLRLARRFADAPDEFREHARSVFGWAMLLLVPAAIVGAAAADLYVRLLFRRQYPAPVALTQCFMLILVFCALDNLLKEMLNAADRQDLDLRALGLGAILYAGALILLVPRWHVWGALAALALAEAAQLGYRFHALTRTMGGLLMQPREGARQAAIAGVFLFLGGVIARSAGAYALVPAVFLGGLAYPVAIAVGGNLRESLRRKTRSVRMPASPERP